MTSELQVPTDGGTPAIGDLRGRIQADLFAALPAHFRRLGWTADQLRDWQRGRLRRLLAAAISRSAFHARRLRGIDPSYFELADLPSLPVMTKTEMMARFDELISDRALTREAAERALAATRDAAARPAAPGAGPGRAGRSQVTVEAVPALPRHPETGKLRRVIPA